MFKRVLSFGVQLAAALGGLAAILSWANITRDDIRNGMNHHQWLWFVIGCVLFAISVRSSLILWFRKLPEDIIARLIKVGQLRSLAGRGKYLAEVLENIHEEFVQGNTPMPNPLGLNVIPDKIEAYLDKELWSFRDKYRSYSGSLEAADPECDSELMRMRIPCETDYLTLKRRIDDHVSHLNTRADKLLASARQEYRTQWRLGL